MNKILLVYDEYADLMSVEADLKKVGFDVVGLSSEYAMAEQIVAFNPDLVIGAGKGPKVSSLGVGKRLKEMSRWTGKVVLIFSAKHKPDPKELIKIRVDMFLESPVTSSRLIQVLAHMLGHEESVLLERLKKVSNLEVSAKDVTSVSGGGKHSPEREAIYIKGDVKEAEAEETEDAFSAERIDVESEEGPLSGLDQKGKMSFRFGDRSSESSLEGAEESSEEEEQAFPDVDLSALERELTGGGVPEVERVEEAVPSELEEIQLHAQESLAKAEELLGDKMSRYAKMLEGVDMPPKSTLTRVEARRRQKNLEADWDSQNLSELDKLRQEFTKAMFKK